MKYTFSIVAQSYPKEKGNLLIFMGGVVHNPIPWPVVPQMVSFDLAHKHTALCFRYKTDSGRIALGQAVDIQSVSNGSTIRLVDTAAYYDSTRDEWETESLLIQSPNWRAESHVLLPPLPSFSAYTRRYYEASKRATRQDVDWRRNDELRYMFHAFPICSGEKRNGRAGLVPAYTQVLFALDPTLERLERVARMLPVPGEETTRDYEDEKRLELRLVKLLNTLAEPAMKAVYVPDATSRGEIVERLDNPEWFDKGDDCEGTALRVYMNVMAVMNSADKSDDLPYDYQVRLQTAREFLVNVCQFVPALLIGAASSAKYDASDAENRSLHTTFAGMCGNDWIELMYRGEGPKEYSSDVLVDNYVPSSRYLGTTYVVETTGNVRIDMRYNKDVIPSGARLRMMKSGMRTRLEWGERAGFLQTCTQLFTAVPYQRGWTKAIEFRFSAQGRFSVPYSAVVTQPDELGVWGVRASEGRIKFWRNVIDTLWLPQK